MRTCNARHPDRPGVICLEWSHHRAPEHQGYAPGALQIASNEVRWEVAPRGPLRPCAGCGMVQGHNAGCAAWFGAHYAFRGDDDD